MKKQAENKEVKVINFMKYRYVFLTISFCIIVFGLIYGFVTGFKFDIDFKGGTKIETDLNQEFSNTDIENIVSEVIGSKPLVQTMSGGNSSVSITTDVISEQQVDEIVQALKEKYPNMSDPSTRNIQPSYGRDLVESAVVAVVVSVILILIYIAIRFKVLGLNAAITAIIALIHDSLFIIAIYGIFKLPINSSFVAVILTIIGYSINDTIIIYDRIRENRKKVSRSLNLLDTINYSISQTITRTIYTSLTTVVAIGIVYVFALTNNQQVLKEFSLPLIIGILVGTYSSIFIATSLWNLLENITKKFKDRKKEKNNKSKNKKK